MKNVIPTLDYIAHRQKTISAGNKNLKKIKERKNKFVFVLMNKSNKALIQKISAEQGLTMSSFCLNSILKNIKDLRGGSQ